MLELLSENRSFGGLHRRYRHPSSELNGPANLAVYLPPRPSPGSGCRPFTGSQGSPAPTRT